MKQSAKEQVDGQPHEIESVTGYPGTVALRGPHQYIFTFWPRSSAVGLVVTLMRLLSKNGLLWLDARKPWSKSR